MAYLRHKKNSIIIFKCSQWFFFSFSKVHCDNFRILITCHARPFFFISFDFVKNINNFLKLSISLLIFWLFFDAPVWEVLACDTHVDIFNQTQFYFRFFLCIIYVIKKIILAYQVASSLSSHEHKIYACAFVVWLFNPITDFYEKFII